MRRFFCIILVIVATGGSIQAQTSAPPSPVELDASMKYLLKALADDNWGVKQDARKDLIAQGQKAVVPLLEMAVGSRDGDPVAAVEILGELESLQVVEPLVALLQQGTNLNSAYKLRTEVAVALGKLGDARAVDGLMYAAGPDEKFRRVRYASLNSLGQIGDPRAVTFLMLILKRDIDPVCRDCAVDALDAISGTAFGYNNKKRMVWINANHPEWLELDDKSFIHPGLLALGGAVAVFGVFGIFIIRWVWKNYLHP